MAIDFLGNLWTLGAHSILLPPTPRAPNRCCSDISHFSSEFSGPKFIGQTKLWAHFMAKSQRFCAEGFAPIRVPLLEKIFGRGVWGCEILKRDGIHLEKSATLSLCGAIESLANATSSTDVSALETEAIIPAEVGIAEWAEKTRQMNPGVDLLIQPDVKFLQGTAPRSSGSNQTRSHPYKRQPARGGGNGRWSRGQGRGAH